MVPGNSVGSSDSVETRSSALSGLGIIIARRAQQPTRPSALVSRPYASQQIETVLLKTLAFTSEITLIGIPTLVSGTTNPSTHKRRWTMRPVTPGHILHTVATMSSRKPWMLRPLPFHLEKKKSNLGASIENKTFPSRRASIDGG